MIGSGVGAPSTLLLVLLTSAISVLGWRRPQLVGALAFWPIAMRRGGQAWRFVSYGFVHADLQHLLFNMLTLWFFGPPIERLLGRSLGALAYPAFYVAALIVAIVPSYLRHRGDPRYSSLGASGAVSAVLFAYVMLRPWSTILVFVVPLPAIVYAALYTVYSVMMDRTGADRINHSAHLAGGAFGALFVLVMVPGAVDVFLHEIVRPRFHL